MPTTAPAGFAEAQAAVADVEGWMTPGQARAPLGLRLARCPTGAGSSRSVRFRGRSMIVLATAAEAGVELVAIDPHAGNDRGPQEIEGFEDDAAEDHDVFNAQPRAGRGAPTGSATCGSSPARRSPTSPATIDLLYIDGAHRYAPALDDIRRWGAKVRPGGTLLIHDSFSSVGVTGALVARAVLRLGLPLPRSLRVA